MTARNGRSSNTTAVRTRLELIFAKDTLSFCVTHAPWIGRHSQPRHPTTCAAVAQALEQGYQQGDAEVRVGPNYIVRLQEMSQYNETTGARV